MRGELMMYAVWNAGLKRWYIDTCESAYWPLPEGAVPLGRIDREDRSLLINLAIKAAQRGKSPGAIARMLEGREDGSC